MRYWRFVIFFLLTVNSQVFCQRQNYRVFTENDGLPSSTIYSIKQDSKGYIWICTDQGVSRFDGYEFQNFSIVDGVADSEVFNIFEDSKGRIWHFTFNGKVSFYQNGKFYNSKNLSVLGGLDSESMINNIFEDSNGRIWFSFYKNGLKVLHNNSTHHVLDDGKTICQTGQISENNIVIFGKWEMLMYNINSNSKSDVFRFDKDDVLYISKFANLSKEEFLYSDKTSVYKFNISQSEKRTIFNHDRDFYYDVNNILVHGEKIWISTKHGAFEISKNVQRHVLKNYNVFCTFIDRNGNYWFGTKENGIFYQSKNKILSFTADDGLVDNNIIQLATTENDLCFLYKKDYYGTIQNHRIKNIPILHGVFKDGDNRTMLLNNNIVWIAKESGIVRITEKSQDIVDIPAKDIQFGNDNKLFIASRSGLYIWSVSDFDYLKDIDNHLNMAAHKYKFLDKRIQKLRFDVNENLWISSQNGIEYLKHDFHEPIRANIDNGIRANQFYNFSDSVVIIATDGNGLIFSTNFTEFDLLTTKDGLSSDHCNSIIVDDELNIWVATNKGLNKITGFPNSLKIDIINTQDGLNSDYVNDVLIKEDTVWLATMKGINYFKSSTFELDRNPPKIQIEKIIVNDSLFKIQSDSLDLTYKQDKISIEFVGISPSHGSDILYKYKITQNDDWSYTRNRSIDFSSLSPGNYHFQVAARSKSSSWSTASSLRIFIHKPFWQTNIFVFLSSLSILFIIVVIIVQVLSNKQKQYNQKQKVVQSELKSLKAQMNPHFMFNALNSIQGELLAKDPETARNYLIKLSRLMRQVLDHSESMFVNIEDEVAMINNYLDIERYKTSEKFDYCVQISPEIDTTFEQIPSMIIQPFLENSIWHGFSDNSNDYKLNVNIEREGVDGIKVSIRDNGIGRNRAKYNTHKTHASKGLKLINDRIEALNFAKEGRITLQIHDSNGWSEEPGTTVIIKIPKT